MLTLVYLRPIPGRAKGDAPIMPGSARPPNREAAGDALAAAASTAAALAEAAATASPEGALRCGAAEKSVNAEDTSSRSRVSTCKKERGGYAGEKSHAEGTGAAAALHYSQSE